MDQNDIVYRVGDWVKNIHSGQIFEITAINKISNQHYLKLVHIRMDFNQTNWGGKLRYPINKFNKRFIHANSARILYSNK